MKGLDSQYALFRCRIKQAFRSKLTGKDHWFVS